ncbi:MAG: hypothetical protein HRU10_13585 [Opitutales bacterium]|nr:hypothetical protein [Opitutales bacterium]
MAELFMIVGFLMAAYAIVANDSIQTLGTFLASNAKRPWWVKWIFAGSILIAAITLGYLGENKDVTWGRLDRFPEVVGAYPKDTKTGEPIKETIALKQPAGVIDLGPHFTSISLRFDQTDDTMIKEDALLLTVTRDNDNLSINSSADSGSVLVVDLAANGPQALWVTATAQDGSPLPFDHIASEDDLFAFQTPQVNGQSALIRVNPKTLTFTAVALQDDDYLGSLPIFQPTKTVKIEWFFVLPTIALLILTRFGFPVSTSFLVLTVFTTSNLPGMVQKSLIGYAVAFAVGMIVYVAVMNALESKWSRNKSHAEHPIWMTLQWISTGWLWFNWLRQDLANIFVYLPRGESLPILWLILAVLAMVLLQGFIFYQAGGKIQKVVTDKTNTSDIRSATIVDFIYGTILWYFKELNELPMSTTWVFLGLLAGREIGMSARRVSQQNNLKTGFKMMALDAGKAGVGLIVSVVLAVGVPALVRAMGG